MDRIGSFKNRFVVQHKGKGLSPGMVDSQTLSKEQRNQGVTSIRTRTHAEDQQMLLDLVADLPRTILVASDLHLGLGRDEITGTFFLMENFLADEAFGRWLEHYRKETNGSALLILNGDIFDFLRITSYPETDEDYALWSERLTWLGETERAQALERPVAKVEQEFGLRTHDYKTLWKLLLIIKGHQLFFQAIADWVAAGGKLIFVKGNHDVELYWPLVRQAIRDELVRRGNLTEAVEAQVAFADGSIQIGNLYIEHGHQYESMTHVVGDAVLTDDPTQITLPVGSFINRYLINKIERLDPFIDNIKPVYQALLALLRRRPVTILGAYFRAWRFVWRAIKKQHFFNHAVALILVGLLVPVVTVALMALFILSPQMGDRLMEWVPLLQQRWVRISGSVGGILFPVLLPYVLGALGELLRALGLLRSRDHLAEGARSVLPQVFSKSRELRRVYAIMGHTHVQDIRRLATSPREEFYINTGTWIPLWPQDRLDLIGRTIYSFARFDRFGEKEYRHQALEWDDNAMAPRQAHILVPAERKRDGR